MLRRNQLSRSRLLAVLAGVVGLVAALVPFSLWVGWNLFSGLLFWVVITPVLAWVLPGMVLRHGNHLKESLGGLVAFYALMVFLIYDHAGSDLFKLMMGSLVFNLIAITVLGWPRKAVTRTAH